MKTAIATRTGMHAPHARGLASLLLVDDEPANLRVGVDMLRGHGFEVLVALNGADGLRIATAEQPGLILLDIRMPGLDGIRVCERLQADPTTRHIPVIFVTALHDIDDKARGFGAGGVDYITKPFVAQELLLRVTTHLRLAGRRRADPLAAPSADEPPASRDIRLLLRARELLRSELARPHGIDSLARELATNRTTLSRVFRVHLGCSVMDYLREQRLRRAQRLLKTTDLKIGPIADAVGYRNARDLTRAFRARFGITPSALRQDPEAGRRG